MRVTKTITITPNTPINIVTGLNAAQMASAGMTSALAPAGSTFFVEYTVVRRLFIQMLHGGTGLGYVTKGSIGRAPSAKGATSGDLMAELAAATATAPGGSYSDPENGIDRGNIEIQHVWIDGDSADKVLVSYDLEV